MLMGSISAPGAAEKDAAAFVAFLDSQHEVDKKKKIGIRHDLVEGENTQHAVKRSSNLTRLGAEQMALVKNEKTHVTECTRRE